MPPHEICLKEQDWGKLWEILKQHSSHVIEGDKSGGFRDRLLLLETDVKGLKKFYWLSPLIGGVIGGLISTSVPEFFNLLFRIFK